MTGEGIVMKMARKRQAKKALIIVLLLLGLYIFIGCTQKEQETISSDEKQSAPKVATEEAIQEKDLSHIVKSPLTGLRMDKEKLNDRVIAVMLDNQYSARPQAGISKCDIVYEILAEGNITRYMGIIGSEQPDDIGPVRSARDYFIDKALEYDALYVHVGGSPQAYLAIPDLKVASVDAMNQGSDIFWRKTHKYAPHNMYTEYNAIIKGAERKNYRKKGEYENLLFSYIDRDIQGQDLTGIKFPYDGNRYYSAYEYNADKKVYDRYINGEPHLDEDGDIPINTKNIIVQFTETKKVKGDSEGRLAIKMIGEGTGLYITNGKYIDITWKKTDEYAITKYFNEQGKEILLNPGKTWIQLYPTNRIEELIIK